MPPTPSPLSAQGNQPSAEAALDLCATAAGLLEQGEWARAISTLQRALALAPAFAEGWLELGNAQMRADNRPEAIAAYQRAIHLDPSLSEAHANLAMAFREQGRPEAAITAYRAALAIDPTDGEALMDLGLLLQEREQWKEAYEAFSQAQAIAPSAPLLARLAYLLARQADWQGAAGHYRQALQLLADTDDKDLRAQLLARLGVALHQLGQLEDAIHTYGQALKLQPALVEINAHRNTALERLKALLSQARQALHTWPATASATASDNGSQAAFLTKLGTTFHRAGCLEDAIHAYEQALALQPDLEAVQTLHAKAMEQRLDPHLLVEIAERFNLLGMFADQLTNLQQAAALAPDNPDIQLDLGLALLRCGRFVEGWPLYAFRGNLVGQSSALPPWQADVPCHRLLILPPKDLGDQIMLASLLSEASALAPEPAVLADPRLHSLLARSFPGLRVLAPGQPFHTAEFEAQIRLGSLAAHLRPSKEHFQAHRQAYLVADPAKTQALRQRHLPGQVGGQGVNGELLVGICWCSTSPANGVMKSLSLETLAGALAAPGVRLLSLQYGDTRSERDQLRRATGLDVLADPEVDTFTDIDNLASLIAACDVVVSVSNTTAHLAGALGQRTWLLIDSRLDWRWGLNDPDSLWTPATRLFRQTTAGDWATPLAAVQAELQALRRQGSRPAPTTPAPGRERWVF